MKVGSYLENVRNQYEDYPYPPRNPEDEKTRLLTARSSALDCINHVCFGGVKEFDAEFEVLVAGGGTGDCSIFLAEQLRNTNARIVHLDMTEHSINIAKERAKIRKLDNIEWIHESILNIPQLDIGKFDFISCSGVLHHLDDPDEGFSALKTVLKDEGSINIMVYGTYGRIPVYQMQDLMRRINKDVEDVEERITNTKKALGSLPPTNWLKFNGSQFEGDLSTNSGLYDLFLHSQDRSYTVPEFYEFGDKQGLKLHALVEGDHPMGQLIFEPQTYIRDTKLLQHVLSLPQREQHAICELMFGQCTKLNGFFSHQEKTAAQIEDQNLIPHLSVVSSHAAYREHLKNMMNQSASPIKINDFIGINKTNYTSQLFNAIDGKTSTKDIVKNVANQSGASVETLDKEFKQLFNMLHKASIAYLKGSAVSDYRTMSDMEISK